VITISQVDAYSYVTIPIKDKTNIDLEDHNNAILCVLTNTQSNTVTYVNGYWRDASDNWAVTTDRATNFRLYPYGPDSTPVDTQRMFGRWKPDVYQCMYYAEMYPNTDRANFDTTGLTKVYTGLVWVGNNNVAGDGTKIYEVETNSYTNNDSDTVRIYGQNNFGTGQ